jgi:cell division protein FtsZ
MQGAKGVIISIIGGDDMKLLEVDEAANHIRELVDPNANIIWGSAFNPDLQGKIRVSVVATGIEQSAEMAEIAARPLNLTASRGPIRPAIVTPAAAPEPVFQPTLAPAPEPVAAEPEETATAANDLDLDDFAEEADALELTDEDGAAAEEVTKAGYASLTGVAAARGDALDLGLDQVDDAEAADAGSGASDDLLGSANRLAEEDGPVSPLVTRRKTAGAPGAGSRSPVAGNTLFERMANLSRGVKPAVAEESDDDDDDGSAISIPRFLGRQNNQ